MMDIGNDNFFGRINAFRRRIGELGENRSHLKSTQWSLVESLKKLHTELPKMDERLELIEEEHSTGWKNISI